MDRGPEIQRLFAEARSGLLSRRDVLRRALVLGLSIPTIGALLAACGDEDEDATATSGTGAGTATTGAGDMTPTMGEGNMTPTMGEDGEPTATSGDGGSGEMTMDNPPAVANAEAASQYSGTQITYQGDGVGIGSELDQILSTKFTEETGIQVEVIPRPESATETYAGFQRLFQAQSADLDVAMIDVIWPGAFAPHLLDLTEAFSDVIGNYYETIVQNNTIDGKLVGIPWFADFGMLFYRTDLTEEYGFDGPPATWDDLEEQARTIMEGEVGENPNFVGFVFQGNAYEGLTCDGLEWLASSGGGTILEDGQVTLDNDAAKEILNKARGWVGTIAPAGVTTYQEEDARNVFQGGNAAFMRNWPYAYSLAAGDDSPIAGMFDVAPLPAQEGNDHVGTVGGWQLAVSNYSENPEASIEFVRYMTSPEVQTWRAVVASFVPTIATVAEDPQVVAAMPFLENLADVVRVTRPSSEAGDLYNEVSTEFFQGVNEILNGADANDEVPDIAEGIADILGL
jgi:trehalose/maltose transport system substrate-binding protein